MTDQQAIDPLEHFAHAELFYGLAWDPEDLDRRQAEHLPPVLGLADGGEGEWWKTLLLSQGMVDPWLTAPQEIEFGTSPEDQARYLEAHRDWREEHDSDIDAWRRAARLLQDDYGVDVGWHGSSLGGGTRYPHLFIVGSIQSADQWEAKPVSLSDLELPEPTRTTWDLMIKRFAEDLQVVMDGTVGPGWLLTAGLA